MENIFEIEDKTMRKIKLTKERWNHITDPRFLHPYMTNYLEEIKLALVRPAIIVPHVFDSTKRNYYLYLKEKKRYLLVSVKYLNGRGEVITSFITRKIMKK